MKRKNLNTKENIRKLFKEIFKNFSSYNGFEFDKTLSLIRKEINLKTINFSPKKKIQSWKHPNYRKINKAILKKKNKILANFNVSKFYVWQNSISVKKKISYEELKLHLNYNKKNKLGIPLYNAAYINSWGFSLPYKEYIKLNKNSIYDVEIKSSTFNCNLKVGELFIKGKSKEEILIDVVISCPSLGNNISAIVTIIELAKHLQSKKNYFSYRILFTPETIGPLAMLKKLKKNKNILGGSCFTNLAYANVFNYKKSRSGSSIFDKAIFYLKKENKNIKINIRNFDTKTGYAGNEKAYNSLGFNCEMGNFSRATLNSYPEYDTNLDNEKLISFKNINESLDILKKIIEIIELERRPVFNFIGEPSYSFYGLDNEINNLFNRSIIDFLVTFSDGNNSLLDFAINTNFKLEDLNKFSNILVSKKILKNSKVGIV